MASWSRTKVADVADVIGGATPSTKEPNYWGGAIPWLTPKDLSTQPSKYTSRGSRSISEAGLSSSGTKLLPAGSVLLSSRAPIGLVSIAANPLTTNQGFKSLVLNESQSPEFWYYLLRLNTAYLESVSSGSTFSEISGSVVKNLEFLLPDIAEQRRIAGVLGALDDLIDTNQQLIANQLELSTAAFDEAFPNFNLGDTPFANLVTVTGGGTPKTDVPDYWSGTIPWFSVVDTPSAGQAWVFDTQKHISDLALQNSSTKLLKSHTVILTARGTVGNIALTATPMAMNQSCYALNCAMGGQGYFTYFATKSIVQALQQSAHGSVFDTITRQTLDAVKVKSISASDISAFDKHVASLFDAMRELGLENSEMRRTRDELLPLLMSGKIRVREAEEVVASVTKGDG